ncbi:hypothetical protein EJB05_55648, partial [Eragrostis curvula]
MEDQAKLSKQGGDACTFSPGGIKQRHLLTEKRNGGRPSLACCFLSSKIITYYPHQSISGTEKAAYSDAAAAFPVLRKPLAPSPVCLYSSLVFCFHSQGGIYNTRLLLLSHQQLHPSAIARAHYIITTTNPPSLCRSDCTALQEAVCIITKKERKRKRRMRLSCNGCRVLRKGCSDSCSIRPCLQWIKSPDAQANATVFLAKFYGRAGLMNLIDAGAESIRPAIFRSLLYEACGRIVNPVYGSVGLLWSGNWHMCQAAVEAVLKGAPIVQISSADAAAPPPHLLPAVQNHKQAVYDIRHNNNNKQQQHAASSSSSHGNGDGDAASAVPLPRGAEKDGGLLHKVAKPGRPSFKRTSTTKPAAGKPKQQQQQPPILRQADEHRHASPDHHHEEDEHHHASSASSVSHVSQAEQSTDNQQQQQHDDSFFQDSEEQQQPGPGPALDLTLGFAPLTAAAAPCFPPPAAPTVPVTGGGCAAGEPGFVGLRFL